jgi:hypothetical protein
MQQIIANIKKRKADPIIVRVRLMWRKFMTVQFSQQMCTSSDKHCQGYTLFRQKLPLSLEYTREDYCLVRIEGEQEVGMSILYDIFQDKK